MMVYIEFSLKLNHVIPAKWKLKSSNFCRCRSGDHISGLGIPRYPVASIVVLQPFSVLL